MDKIGCMVIEVAIGEIINRIGIQSAGVRSGSGSATLGISLAGGTLGFAPFQLQYRSGKVPTWILEELPGSIH